MSEKTVAEQVAEGVQRALEHADPAQRLAMAKAGMSDALRSEVVRQRSQREATILTRVYGGKADGPRWHDEVDGQRIVGVVGDRVTLADGSTRSAAQLKRAGKLKA